MKLSEYKFGYADATKELMIEPEIFEQAFYDPHSILSKLVNGWKYMLIGRKGVGKSAFSAKIQFMATHEGMYYAQPIQLNDFEYTTFAKASSDADLVGTKKYLDAWNFIIILNVYKILHNVLNITEVAEFNKTISLLDKLGFPITDTFKASVTNVSRLKLGATVGIFDAEYENEFGHKPISFSDRVGGLVEKMQATLNSVFLQKNCLFLLMA